MLDKDRTFVLGVDAGGTNSVAAIAGADGEVLFRRRTGPGNPIRTGKDSALMNVIDVMRLVAEDADVELAKTFHAVIGMAGAGAKTTQVEVGELIRRRTGIKQLTVIADYELVLPAAGIVSGFSNGISLIAGTGSSAYGVRGDRKSTAGGKGFRVGDEGSGFWIGKQAIKAIVDAVDRGGPETALLEQVCKVLDLEAASLVTAIRENGLPLESIAALAPIVVSVASSDSVACEILDRAAGELARLVETVGNQLEYATGEFPLAIAGSVLTKTAVVRERLDSALQQIGLSPCSTKVVDDPVVGAIRLARQRIR